MPKPAKRTTALFLVAFAVLVTTTDRAQTKESHAFTSPTAGMVDTSDGLGISFGGIGTGNSFPGRQHEGGGGLEARMEMRFAPVAGWRRLEHQSPFAWPREHPQHEPAIRMQCAEGLCIEARVAILVPLPPRFTCCQTKTE
jgi:hypothetical protein